MMNVNEEKRIGRFLHRKSLQNIVFCEGRLPEEVTIQIREKARAFCKTDSGEFYDISYARLLLEEYGSKLRRLKEEIGI